MARITVSYPTYFVFVTSVMISQDEALARRFWLKVRHGLREQLAAVEPWLPFSLLVP